MHRAAVPAPVPVSAPPAARAAAVAAALAARAAAVAAALVAGFAAPADASWTWPVRGDVITPFVVGPDRFARGQHRGIDIAVRAGAPVRAACGGRVRFAGPVPGRGRGVTVVCGALVATHLELGRVFVRRRDRVAAGAPVGTVAASHVQLGARRAGRAHGYVDPLDLLGPEPPPPLGAVPRPHRPRPHRPPARGPLPAPARPAPVPAPAPAPQPAPAPAPQPAPAPAPQPVAVTPRDPDAVPLTAWLGLAALAVATPVGAFVRRRNRRRRVAAVPRPAAPSTSA